MIPGIGGTIGGLAASAGGGGPTYPLDGLPAPTSAMSVDRDLLSSFAGGTKYTTATGVDSAKDQSGNTRHWNQSSTSLQPVISTMGSHSRACMSFDGSDDYLVSNTTLPNLMTVSNGLVVTVALVNSISTDSTSPYQNNCIFGDNGAYLGIGFKSTGPVAEAFNFNGSFWNKVTAAISTGSVHVFMWRHTGTTLYLSIDGGTEVSVSSPDNSSLAGVSMYLARTTGAYGSVKIAEHVTWGSTMPTAPQLAAYIADCIARYS